MTSALRVAYDANGNTLSDPSGKQYSWDFENRLTQAIVPGTGTVAFKYDPFGRRIQKSSPLGTVNYLYDGRNLLEELDASSNVLARYNQGPSIDEPISELRGLATSYYQVDFLGSVTSLSNPAGALENTYTYDSFGNLTASSESVTNPLRFTAREFDPETGIYNYRFRYYDENIGRFLSEDPIGFGGGVDFYRYADGNPISANDPLGLETTVCYYPDTPVGHVGFGLPGEPFTSGFYPEDKWPSFYHPWGGLDGPGGVFPDNAPDERNKKCKVIPSSPKDDQCMFNCRRKWLSNPGDYKVATRQCTGFVRECLRECHLPAGNYNGPKPQPFFNGLP